MFSSQVSTINRVLALSTQGCEFESRWLYCSCKNWLCLKFRWTGNSLLIVLYETGGDNPSLSWLNMVWIGYSSPCGCSISCLKVFHCMVCLGLQWSANICKVCWGCVKIQRQGVQCRNFKVRWHNVLKITYVFLHVFLSCFVLFFVFFFMLTPTVPVLYA